MALVDTLMLRGYSGPEWDEFVRALAQYGVQVIRSWVLKDLIFIKCGEKGIGLDRRTPRRSREEERDDAQELANETVANGIVAFKNKVLIPRKWNPQKGASLKTFFIGQCLFQFPNVYRAWLAEVRTPRVDGVLPEMLIQEPSDPHHVAVLTLEMRAFTANDPRLIAAMTEAGYTQIEIAEILRTTWRAVESRFRRAKMKGLL